MKSLTPAQRRELRARAHALHPVAMISEAGLSASVLAEIERGLKIHELIKIRVFGADRDQRDLLLSEICAQTEALPVQHIGKILVIFREKPEPPREPAKRRPPIRRDARPGARTAASTAGRPRSSASDFPRSRPESSARGRRPATGTRTPQKRTSRSR